jgi:hypothetical protein
MPHTPDEALPPLIETPPGLYRHYKDRLYEVIGTVRHSESLEPMTLYRVLRRKRPVGTALRPCSMKRW